MRLTVATGSDWFGSRHAEHGRTTVEPLAHGVTHAGRLTLVVALILASIGILFSPANRAGAATVFQSGQVFASTGNSTVSVYDPASGNLLSSLTDNTSSPTRPARHGTPTGTCT